MVLLVLQPSTVRLGAHADISSAARPSRALLLLLLPAASLPLAGSVGGPEKTVGSRSWWLLLLLLLLRLSGTPPGSLPRLSRSRLLLLLLSTASTGSIRGAGGSKTGAFRTLIP